MNQQFASEPISCFIFIWNENLIYQLLDISSYKASDVSRKFDLSLNSPYALKTLCHRIHSFHIPNASCSLLKSTLAN